MALIGEEVVEEWLRQQGYFTIRGIKLGVHEMDVLAVKPSRRAGEPPHLRHVEVQVSMNPVSHLTPWTKKLQKEMGIAPMSRKSRSAEQVTECVVAWVDKKFMEKRKANLRQHLYPGQWEFELVVHNVKFPDEIEALKKQHINVIRLVQILRELESWAEHRKKERGFTASGAPLIDLMLMRAGKAPLTPEQSIKTE